MNIGFEQLKDMTIGEILEVEERFKDVEAITIQLPYGKKINNNSNFAEDLIDNL